MKTEPTPLAGVMLITPTVHGDARGFFLETWHADRYAQAGITHTFVQDNHSRSAQGILRGLHLQTEMPQGKLVRVTSGAVFDVVVDCRAESPSCGQWYGATLTAEGQEQLWVPPGCAHGFYVLSESGTFSTSAPITIIQRVNSRWPGMTPLSAWSGLFLKELSHNSPARTGPARAGRTCRSIAG